MTERKPGQTRIVIDGGETSDGKKIVDQISIESHNAEAGEPIMNAVHELIESNQGNLFFEEVTAAVSGIAEEGGYQMSVEERRASGRNPSGTSFGFNSRNWNASWEPSAEKKKKNWGWKPSDEDVIH